MIKGLSINKDFLESKFRRWGRYCIL